MNLISTIEGGRVISIEAGFGQGKTFFRDSWAQQLREGGEVVVELDVLHSDHSGDPIVTLLGALVRAVPTQEETRRERAFRSASRIASLGAKAATRAALRAGAEELIEAATDAAVDQVEDYDGLSKIVEGVGDGMSKFARHLISSQLASEKVRTVELPRQLRALQSALNEGSGNNRVVVIVDELDRCHPEYALSFLEAMKVVFAESGFVFCLMVNSKYLEGIARHKFGIPSDEEPYIEKFIDLRLSLRPDISLVEQGSKALALDLPLQIPFGSSKEFSVERAAELFGSLAVSSAFSMRKLKRIILKLEVALRCYPDRPLDLPLLVVLAFEAEGHRGAPRALPRASLTPEEGEAKLASLDSRESVFDSEGMQLEYRLNKEVSDRYAELLAVVRDHYVHPSGSKYKDWALIFDKLAPHYLPDHRKVLEAVAAIVADSE